MLFLRFPKLEKPIKISSILLFICCLFLLLFPKGGVKIGGVPLTWGYLSLGFLGLVLLFKKSFTVYPKKIIAFLFCTPFQIICVLISSLNGVEATGFFISLLVSFFFLPFLFFILLSEAIEEIQWEFFVKIFKFGMIFIATYGILLFFINVVTGSSIEIPFLTTNYHDLGEMGNKCNNRYFISKLSSTYNNGNLYGISLLMLLPLYNLLESSFLKRGIIKFSLVLTFSRTVWIGLIISELLYAFFVKKKIKFKLLLSLTLIGISLILLKTLFGIKSEFFLDSSLGGRINQLREINNNIHLFSSKPFFDILEIVYLSILSQFGLIGLLAFALTMTSSLCIYMITCAKFAANRAIFSGLVTYLIIAFSDGALLYIPVMAFYWFLSSLLLNRKTWSEKKAPQPDLS